MKPTDFTKKLFDSTEECDILYESTHSTESRYFNIKLILLIIMKILRLKYFVEMNLQLSRILIQLTTNQPLLIIL